MKITLLGTSDATGQPAPWCECKICQHARQHGGNDVRRRTSYLIDDDILVDYGPDINWQVMAFNVDLRTVRRVFWTHSHVDHENVCDMTWRREPWYSVVSHPVDIYGDEAVMNRMLKYWSGSERGDDVMAVHKLRSHVLLPGDECQEEDLQVLALPANHAPEEKPLLYLFTRNGKSVFIASDTGYFPDLTWKLLEGRKIDAMIVDCTGGIHPEYGHNTDGHSGAFTDEQIRRRLMDMGCLSASAPVVLTHISHRAESLHEDMVRLMEPRGLTVGYDGMELKV